MMKPGYKTTEFWLSLLAVILGAIASSGLIDAYTTVAQVIAVGIAALTALGYSATRGYVKANARRSEVYEREFYAPRFDFEGGRQWCSRPAVGHEEGRAMNEKQVPRETNAPASERPEAGAAIG